MVYLLRLRVWSGALLLRALRPISAVGRAVFRKDSGIGRALRRTRRAIRGTPGSKIAELLKAFARAYPDVVFVQIGANDGVLEDPLRPFVVKHGWRGVLVEPVKAIHERLKQNYAGVPGLKFENVAIAGEPGVRDFFRIDDSADAGGDGDLPAWYRGLGSLSRDVVLKHAAEYPEIARRLVTESVECITFAQLCERQRLTHIDVLSIDAEGHDFEILRQVDFERHRPRLLLYEHHHMLPEQRAACRERLARHGYESFEEILNTACLDVATLTGRDPLRKFWDELKRLDWIPV